MKFQNPMQLKAFIKKVAAEKQISAQLVLQNYFMERLLERIAASNYNNKFILKGGLLIAAMVGLNSRATMDLDLWYRRLKCSMQANDLVWFVSYVRFSMLKWST